MKRQITAFVIGVIAGVAVLVGGAYIYARLGLVDPRANVHVPDMPENQNYYLIKHGMRYSAMPAWVDLVTYQQIWRVVTFLSHTSKLPDQVQQQWKEQAR